VTVAALLKQRNFTPADLLHSGDLKYFSNQYLRPKLVKYQNERTVSIFTMLGTVNITGKLDIFTHCLTYKSPPMVG
jgi:hypothetical protein